MIMNLESYIRQRLSHKPILTMTHVIAGYPSFDDNFRALHIMAKHDVDIVEIQMPFSEPTADGPLFVRANQQALERGVTLDSYFEFLARASQAFPFPLLMMGYYNSVYKSGHDRFLKRLQSAGGSGFILPDLPMEEGAPLFEKARKQSLFPIMLVAPTTPDERMRAIGKAGSGFVYVVARSGVTGTQTSFSRLFEDYISRCRRAIPLPLAVGFGISRAEDIAYLQGKADIAIIGTALLRSWESGGANALDAFLKSVLPARHKP